MPIPTYNLRRKTAPPVREPHEPRFYFGVDLGKAADYSAIAVLRRTQFLNPHYAGPPPVGFVAPPRKLKPDVFHIVAWERYDLHQDYAEVRADVNRRIGSVVERRGDEIVLAIDRTGVGLAEEEYYRADNPHKAFLAPIHFTPGSKAHTDGTVIHVPRDHMVHVAVSWAQTGRLKLAKQMVSSPWAHIFESELRSFVGKQKPRTGNVSYEAWREREHDDLIFALAMACWCAYQELGGGPLILHNFVK